MDFIRKKTIGYTKNIVTTSSRYWFFDSSAYSRWKIIYLNFELFTYWKNIVNKLPFLPEGFHLWLIQAILPYVIIMFDMTLFHMNYLLLQPSELGPGFLNVILLSAQLQYEPALVIFYFGFAFAFSVTFYSLLKFKFVVYFGKFPLLSSTYWILSGSLLCINPCIIQLWL